MKLSILAQDYDPEWVRTVVGFYRGIAVYDEENGFFRIREKNDFNLLGLLTTLESIKLPAEIIYN